MGRGRLRRGFSLEVIFEEDTHFTSYLDSLDSVRILAEEKEADELSVDSLLDFPAHRHLCPHLPPSDSNYSSFDYSLHLSDMDTSLVHWDEFRSSHKDHGTKAQWTQGTPTSPQAPLSHPQEIDNGRRSRVSRREILESPNFLALTDHNDTRQHIFHTHTDKTCADASSTRHHHPPPPPNHSIFLDTTTTETKTDDDDLDEHWTRPPIHLTSRPSPPSSHPSSPPSSPLTDPHTYAVADAHDDVHSIASSTQDYSESSGSVTEQPSPPLHRGGDTGTGEVGDVRRVREMFERTTCRSNASLGSHPLGKFAGKGRWEEDGTPPSLPPRNRAPNPIHSSPSVPHHTISQPMTSWRTAEGKLGGGSPPGVGGPRGTSGGGARLVSAHSHSSFTLNSALDYDYTDLLVNDKVVIEESPDIFQTLRSTRIRADASSSKQQHLSEHPFFSSLRTLRRTKSMGTGIFQPDFQDASQEPATSPSHTPTSPAPNTKSCILAEEMPAPNIVKNVRNVFERLSSSRAEGQRSEGQRVMMVTTSKGGSSAGPSPRGSCGGKQCISLLSSIKSNPSSKILRSESFRDDYTHPHKPPQKALPQNKTFHPPTTPLHSKPVTTPQDKDAAEAEEEKGYEVKEAKEVSKAQESVLPSPSEYITHSSSPSSSSPSDHDPLSLLSMSSMGEDEDPKFIPPHVLSRIRSCGTTTTYFGGQIVAKTIENRILRVNASPLTFSPPQTPTPNSLHHLPLLSPPSAFDTPSHSLSPAADANESLPRIVSVVAKCGGSKGNSPNGSIVEEEGRNSPEGCESEEAGLIEWNSPAVASGTLFTATETGRKEPKGDSNNNFEDACAPTEATSTTLLNNKNKSPPRHEHDSAEGNKKFSEISEGAWF